MSERGNSTTEVHKIKTGQHGLVSLVTEYRLKDEGKQVKAEFGLGSWGRIKSAVLGNLAFFSVRSRRADIALLATSVAYDQEVPLRLLSALPLGDSRRDLTDAAEVLTMINVMHDDRILSEKRDNGVTLPYSSGLLTADFLDVIPRTSAARLLMAASNPDIAQDVLDRHISRAIASYDSQVSAVEGTVLLNKLARHEIFEQLARLSPGREGRARRFLSLIAANWPQQASEFCGPKLIYANLHGELASEQVLEMQADLIELGQLIEAVR